MMKKKKVVLATGIFYPDIGGPAIHVRKIAEALHEYGWDVTVITLGDSSENSFPFQVKSVSRSLSKPIRLLAYFWTAMKAARDANIIYAFNLTVAGMPAFLTAKFLRKKFLMRIGGDPIWERIVEKNKRFLPFSEYYEKKLYLEDKPLLFRAIRFMLQRADVLVMYTPLLKNTYKEHYGISDDKFRIIYNPVAKKGYEIGENKENKPHFLFAGRFVAYKNLNLLIKVFDELRQEHKEGTLALIGEGPDKKKLKEFAKRLPSKEHILFHDSVKQEELFKRICRSTACIGPALTEFNPNFILESLSLQRPVLLSRENGLSVKLPEEFLFDAQNKEEMKEKMRQFFDELFCQKAIKTISEIPMDQTWEKVTASHIKILDSLV